MNVTSRAKTLIVASALATMVGFSSHVFADEDLQKTIESIKSELAEHVGVFGGFDRKRGMVTLGGHTDDPAGLNAIIERIKAVDGVKEVRSSVTQDN